MANNTATPASNPRPIRPVNAIACLACRSKHLKCDAHTPVCNRCRVKAIECVYKGSRRGFRPRNNARGQNSRTPQGSPSGPASTIATDDGLQQTSSHIYTTERAASDNAYTPIDFQLQPTPSEIVGFPFNSTWPGVAHNSSLNEYTEADIDNLQSILEISVSSSGQVNPNSVNSFPHAHYKRFDSRRSTSQLEDLFYRFVHPAHPFILPEKTFKHSRQLLPNHLVTVMHFAGSNYSDECKDENQLEQDALEALSDAVPNDIFKIQALLLLAIVLHGRFQETQSGQALVKAIDLAITLQIFKRATIASICHEDLVLEESCIRTWWELCAIAVMLSSFNPSIDCSKLHEAKVDLYLPCEEEEFMLAQSCTPRKTEQDFEARDFMDDDFQFSSFSYKIEAIRLLAAVQSSSRTQLRMDNRQFDFLDNGLSHFWLSLPPSKRDVIESDGKVDEVLFSAHVIANIATIMLHRPRSSLTSVKYDYNSACTKQDLNKVARSFNHTNAPHTAKAVTAANRISNVAGIQVSMIAHSPCLTCALALAAIVHLPACLLARDVDDSLATKERLKLTVSAIGRIGEVWSLAKLVKSQVAVMAREFLAGGEVNPELKPPDEGLFANPAALQLIDDSWLDELPDVGLLDRVDANVFLTLYDPR